MRRPLGAARRRIHLRTPPDPFSHPPVQPAPPRTPLCPQLPCPCWARQVRNNNHAVGTDRILMVASDRISAFDVIMGEPIRQVERTDPDGAVLVRQAWAMCPNHLTGERPRRGQPEGAQVRGRSMLVQRLQPIPVEAVVRGYLAGSGWKEYQESQSVCGVPCPQA